MMITPLGLAARPIRGHVGPRSEFTRGTVPRIRRGFGRHLRQAGQCQEDAVAVGTRRIVTTIVNSRRMTVGPVVRIRMADYGSDRTATRSASRWQGHRPGSSQGVSLMPVPLTVVLLAFVRPHLDVSSRCNCCSSADRPSRDADRESRHAEPRNRPLGC